MSPDEKEEEDDELDEFELERRRNTVGVSCFTPPQVDLHLAFSSGF